MGLIKKLSEKFKDMISGQSKKKSIENAVIVIILGVIIIIAGGSFVGKDDEASNASIIDTASSQEDKAVSKNISNEEKEDLQKKVEGILSQIDGVGKVSVMVTYVSGNEIVPAYDKKETENDTQEKDGGGGTRSIEQRDSESKLVYEEAQGGNKKPIIVKELFPPVKGVVVVADGASDPVVKEKLGRAVQVLMDVPIHKIQVFERKK